MATLQNALPRGTSFARICGCLAKAGPAGLPGAEAIAQHLYGFESREHLALKAAVAAGSITGSTWGGPELAPIRAIVADYVSAVREISVLGQFAMVPENIAIPVSNPAAPIAASFMGEHGLYPVAAGETSTANLRPLKCGAIVPLTAELARFGGPRADALIRQELIWAGVKVTDGAFLDPENAGIADQKPAAINSSATPVTKTASLAGDIKALVAAFTGSLADALLITDPQTSLEISLVDNPGVRIGPDGGSVGTLPLAISTASPRDDGSPSGGVLTLVDKTAVRIADGGAEIDLSSSAALQMDSAPAAGAQNLQSLFQLGILAYRLTRWANWNVPPAGRVAVLRGASY